MVRVIYYVYDPMCSWCWAFNKTWGAVQASLPSNIEVPYVLGGLAPDNDAPMPADMQKSISMIWHDIEQRVPGTQFNHDFWTTCKPRRSTYPASRAVIAAKALDPRSEKDMLLAIQQAYYLNARNPSNADVLIECAVSIGLNEIAFTEALNSASVQQQLLADIKFARSIGANSFPSVVLEYAGRYQTLNYDYNDAQVLLSQLS